MHRVQGVAVSDWVLVVLFVVGATLPLTVPFVMEFTRLAWRDRAWLHLIISHILMMVRMKWRGTLTDAKIDAMTRRRKELELEIDKP